MSSPLWDGTTTSAVFTSKDITILSENIHIKIDSNFKTARFIIEYTIQSDITGKQIPLLFYAQDYKDSFFVWLNNVKVPIQNIPQNEKHIENSSFSMFSGPFKKNMLQDESDEVIIYWYKNTGHIYRINDLKYFETDIAKGIHKVRIEYISNVWTDASGWIKEYSFRYSLTPAKFWKSFGTLNITVEQDGVVRELSTNIGDPIEKTFQATNNWKFNKLPDEYLAFTYTPKTNEFATLLITISPLGFSIMSAFVLFVLHVKFVRGFRRKFVKRKYSPTVMIGSLLVPLLLLLAYMFSHDVIDNAIGDHAGRHHGYVFAVLVLYPIILPVYWISVWLLDSRYKKQLMKNMHNKQVT